MSGMDVIDPARSTHLGELALDIAERVLKPPGHALIKVSKALRFQGLVKLSRSKFAGVQLRKASRFQGS